MDGLVSRSENEGIGPIGKGVAPVVLLGGSEAGVHSDSPVFWLIGEGSTPLGLSGREIAFGVLFKRCVFGLGIRSYDECSDCKCECTYFPRCTGEELDEGEGRAFHLFESFLKVLGPIELRRSRVGGE